MYRNVQRKFLFTIDAFIWTIILMSQSFFTTLPLKNTDWKEKGFAYTYLVASKLTDPLCRAHQLYRQTLIVDPLFQTASTCEKNMRKVLLVCKALSQTFFSLFTTLPGIELRALAFLFQEKPYLYFQGDAQEKQITENSLSLLSWNICCVSGGYAITDGGVLPWQYRIKQVSSQILTKDADIVCLYEIFDIQTAVKLIKDLKGAYSHFYFNIGPKVIGLSSGLCVASKVKLMDPEFVIFPQKSCDGRAKHCNKGFFSFDIQKSPDSVAKIYTTHLQHSEVPDNPTCGEVLARKQSMDLILSHMQKAGDKLCILTGDLNLEEKEYSTASWQNIFDRGNIIDQGCTWGGDQFCSALMGKQSSCPQNLDYTLIMKNMGATLITSYIETNFDGAVFKESALSDHKGLLSVITFKTPKVSNYKYE